MNGGFILRNKKGSVTAAVLLFILAGGFSIRNHRLLRSHIYLDKGIYSVDVRIQEFLADLNEIEMVLNEKYDGIDFSSLLVLSKYCLPTYLPSRLKLKSFVGW